MPAGPGDVLLLTPPMASRARFESTRYVDLEWTTPDAATIEAPRMVGRAELESAASLASTVASPTIPFERALADTRAVLEHAGARLDHLVIDETWLGPTSRDERIASAIGAQLASLATKASAADLGELATLSPRQLQRVLEKFSATYGINAGNWRDMRNRWRLQIAAVLLTHPDLSVADIAKDVGYATATALARAFAAVGYPPPLELRAALLRG
ncbi:MAG: helix-turn-helix domain-containing protein [Deltaproteobacteria bacterium]|nr:helix-turn-helix domain-containing protein [Deltaproteobacteria bacterium]